MSRFLRPRSVSLAVCLFVLGTTTVAVRAQTAPPEERYEVIKGAAVHGYVGNTEIAYEWFADPKKAEEDAAKLRKIEGLDGKKIYDRVEVVPETRKRLVSAPRRPVMPQADVPAPLKKPGGGASKPEFIVRVYSMTNGKRGPEITELRLATTDYQKAEQFYEQMNSFPGRYATWNGPPGARRPTLARDPAERSDLLKLKPYNPPADADPKAKSKSPSSTPTPSVSPPPEAATWKRDIGASLANTSWSIKGDEGRFVFIGYPDGQVGVWKKGGSLCHGHVFNHKGQLVVGYPEKARFNPSHVVRYTIEDRGDRLVLRTNRKGYAGGRDMELQQVNEAVR
ncbi:MAG: hypothetical protein L0Y71_12750 [Gemmataceae bacterium]|nr:hypothetical protein [Gemmataceae bacterium]